MKKFLIGLITGFVLAGLFVLIIAFALVRIGSRQPTVAEGSTLVMKIEGEVPEKAPPELPLPFLESQQPVTVVDVWRSLRKAAADSRIRAVIFEPRGLDVGFAKLQEIHADLLQFRKSGKPLVAFLRAPDARAYYLATAADRIYMNPEDMLDLKGIALEAMYLKGTLDKAGVHADVIHAGKYKDAGDMFTMTSMSPETSEVLNNVLDQYYQDLVQTIATARNKTPAAVQAIIDQGPYNGSQAQSAGLVDVAGFDDQVVGDLQKRLNQSALTRVSLRTFMKASGPDTIGRNRIAFIVGEGMITRGEDQPAFGDTGLMTSGGFTKLLREVGNDSSFKGAIIRIDSPGGDGAASDEILNAVRDLSRKKPVVFSMSDYAASGGYFMAMTGDPIVAYPNTLTGSIGVIFVKFNLHGLFDKLGIQLDILKRGQNADLYSSYQPLTPAQQAKLTQQIDEFYKAFVERVAEGRRRPYDQIEPLAQGRVWLGSQAKQNGLVDQNGGLDTAIEVLRQKAKIGAQEQVTLVAYPPRQSLFEVLMSRPDESPAVSGRMRSEMRALFGDLPLEAWARGGFMKVMPYTLRLR